MVACDTRLVSRGEERVYESKKVKIRHCHEGVEVIWPTRFQAVCVCVCFFFVGGGNNVDGLE